MKASSKLPGIISWTGYLAITLLVTIPLAVLTVRSGSWQQGLMLYAIGCLGSTALMALYVLLLMLPGYRQWRGAVASRALLTVPGILLVATMLAGSGDYPAIHDITTDTDDPPVFTAAADHRGAESNSLDILPGTIEQQLNAYPELKTLRTDLSVDDAFSRAVLVAGDLGWEIYYRDINAGIIEAVDTTSVMAFKDDVVIRVRSNAQGTLLDLRSVSRVGVSDLGANAKRIRAFQATFEHRES